MPNNINMITSDTAPFVQIIDSQATTKSILDAVTDTLKYLPNLLVFVLVMGWQILVRRAAAATSRAVVLRKPQLVGGLKDKFRYLCKKGGKFMKWGSWLAVGIDVLDMVTDFMLLSDDDIEDFVRANALRYDQTHYGSGETIKLDLSELALFCLFEIEAAKAGRASTFMRTQLMAALEAGADDVVIRINNKSLYSLIHKRISDAADNGLGSLVAGCFATIMGCRFNLKKLGAFVRRFTIIIGTEA